MLEIEQGCLPLAAPLSSRLRHRLAPPLLRIAFGHPLWPLAAALAITFALAASCRVPGFASACCSCAANLPAAV
jgi:hypothetical protein